LFEWWKVSSIDKGIFHVGRFFQYKEDNLRMLDIGGLIYIVCTIYARMKIEGKSKSNTL
jgi:hypothetical protein